ncbi:hypothetical protein BDQ12DRAFT_725505 [Crucibulum laeve]|uniref:Uncharacterized protein n=1 Tax=Crucibulum laeve TaxID=68775 RepID=A0A5C3LRZ2_9AGAR|nr:hypothetical protein BDQ12DRAFT_725505 [Crucibulum laeve]
MEVAPQFQEEGRKLCTQGIHTSIDTPSRIPRSTWLGSRPFAISSRGAGVFRLSAGVNGGFASPASFRGFTGSTNAFTVAPATSFARPPAGSFATPSSIGAFPGLPTFSDAWREPRSPHSDESHSPRSPFQHQRAQGYGFAQQKYQQQHAQRSNTPPINSSINSTNTDSSNPYEEADPRILSMFHQQQELAGMQMEKAIKFDHTPSMLLE